MDYRFSGQATPTKRQGSKSLRAPVSAIGGVAVGVAITLVVTSTAGLGVLSHVDCVRGQPIGTALYWTPFSLANAPYGGSTTYSANFTLYDLFGRDQISLKSGVVAQGNISAGYFQTENWTVYTQANSSALGPGMNEPCVSEFGATQAPTNFSVSVDGGILQGPGNTTNAGQPTSFDYGYPNRSAEFSNGFVSANAMSISTCGVPAKVVNFTSTSFEVSLVPTGSQEPTPVEVNVASMETFSYRFPANGGVWMVDDLQENLGLRGPGLAFSWRAC